MYKVLPDCTAATSGRRRRDHHQPRPSSEATGERQEVEVDTPPGMSGDGYGDDVAQSIMQTLHGAGEQLAALFVVLEHVEAGARRRQQHRIARLGQFGFAWAIASVEGWLALAAPASPRGSAINSASRPISTTARQYGHGPSRSLKSAPLPSPPAISSSLPSISMPRPSMAASAAPTLVALESS